MENKTFSVYSFFKIVIVIFLVFNVLAGCHPEFVANPEIVTNKPKACFEYTPIEKIKTTDSIQFSNCSEYSDLFYWDFGDYNYSNEKEPKHLFKNKRSYTVKLLVSKNTLINGENILETDTLSKIIDVNIEIPKTCFDFILTPMLTVTFTNCTWKATNYLWDFGDGTTSIEKEPTHIYSSYGAHKVTLKTTNDGVSDSLSKIINLTDEVSLNDFKIVAWGGAEVDVDFDGITDFRFIPQSYQGVNSGVYIYNTYIEPLNDYVIFSDSINTTITVTDMHALDPFIKTYFTQEFYIPKIYVLGDTIQNYNKTKSGITNFCCSQTYSSGQSYELNNWIKDEVRYVGFRKIVGNKTKIGWIKLKVLGFTSAVLISYKIPTEEESLVIDK